MHEPVFKPRRREREEFESLATDCEQIERIFGDRVSVSRPFNSNFGLVEHGRQFRVEQLKDQMVRSDRPNDQQPLVQRLNVRHLALRVADVERFLPHHGAA